MFAKRLIILWAAAVLLVGCGAPAPGTPPEEIEAAAIETPASDAPAIETADAPDDAATEAAAAGAAACPTASEGTALYVSEDNGLCFLYPADLQLRPDARFPQDAVQLTGAPLDPGAMESFALNLGVFYNGPADGLDSAAYAATWLERSAAEMIQPETVIGGGALAQRGLCAHIHRPFVH